MTGPPRGGPAGGPAAQGVAYFSLAQAAVIVSGYAVHLLAARALDAALYGTLVVALSIAAWVKIAAGQFWIPGISKVISEDPRRLSSVLAGVGGRCGRTALLIAAAMTAAAPLVAKVFGDPALVPLLVVAGLEIPFFTIYSLSRQALAALRRFVRSATVMALYGVGRAAGGCLFILAGWRAVGAMAGLATGSLLAAAAGLWWLLSARRDFEAVPSPGVVRRCRMWAAATLPASMGMVALISLDLWMVKAIVGKGPEVGIYGAAFAVSRMPFMLVQSLTEATFTRVSGALAAGERALARSISRESMRFLMIVYVPLWAVVAGSSQGLMVLLFGKDYAASAPLLDILLAAVVLAAATRQMTSLLAACDRPGLRLAIVAALLPPACGLYLLLVPRYGGTGAALASLMTMAAGTVISGIALRRHLGVRPPLLSAARCGAAGAAVFLLGRWWALAGWLSLVQCAALGAAYLFLLAVTGELGAADARALSRGIRFRERGGP